MKSKKVPAVTLQAIGRLIDEKLKFTNSKIVGIYGELDGIKQQITDVNNGLEARIDALRQETKEGFNTVFDGLDNINRILDKDHGPRLKRLEAKVFAQ